MSLDARGGSGAGSDMFQHHKEKKALEEYQAELAHWQSLRDGYAEMVQLAQGPGALTPTRSCLGPASTWSPR